MKIFTNRTFLSSKKTLYTPIRWHPIVSVTKSKISYKNYQYNLADHQRGTCTLRGIRRRLVLKVESLARVSKIYGLSSMIGTDR